MRIHTSIVAFTVCCLALVHVAAGADFATGGTSRTVSSAFCVDTTLQVADADTDGLPDWWEYAHDLNVMLDDAGADPDADGRTNRDELRWNGDPQVHDSDRPVVGLSPAFSLELAKTVLDTDGDGMPDAWEVAHGLPVAGASATNDADSDGICDLAEYNGGTDPCVADRWQDAMRDAPLALLDTAIFPVESTRDTDGDGMPDWWELRYGLSVELNDAGGDPDHDELSNLVEYHLGLDPTWDERCGVVTRDSALWLLRTRTAVVDADGDHLPAAWEIRHGFSDANPDDALSDLPG